MTGTLYRGHLNITTFIGGRPAPIAGHISCDLQDAHMADGAATIVWPVGTAYLADLIADQLAIRVTHPDGAELWSGRVTSKKIDTAPGTGTITVPFHTDLSRLRDVLVRPNPARAITDQQTDAYRATGPAETVVKQLIAAHQQWFDPTLEILPDQKRGNTITVEARLIPIWDAVIDTANLDGGIGIRITRHPQDGHPILDCYQPSTDVYTMPLQSNQGMVKSLVWETPHPQATVVIVAGYGTGAARVLLEVVNQAAVDKWGRVEKLVEFPNPTYATTADDLELYGLQQLATMLPQNAVTLTLADTDTFSYNTATGVRIGTTVTVSPVTGEAITDVIGGAHITDTTTDGIRTELTVGNPTARTDPNSVLARHLAAIEARLAITS